MNWFTPKCPIDTDDKSWIEESFLWLIDEFGFDTLANVTVILPTNEFFPDEYSEDKEDLQLLLKRLCGWMGVDPNRVELDIFHDEDRQARRSLPFAESSHSGALGHYLKRRDKFVVSVEASQVSDPTCLVATLAHELAHVRLIGEGRISASFDDHEPLTDLLTVFLGLGVFTGNSVFSFNQWTDAFSQGWETERVGYLTEEMFGYALAAFAWLRGESKPGWPKYLEGNVSAYFKSSHKYLERTGDTVLQKLSHPSEGISL